MQETPTRTTVSDDIRSIATSVRKRLEEIWTVEVPDGAIDLRGAPPDDRHERVRNRVERLDSGETLHLISDRDPAPVRDLLLDILDNDSLETFEVKRQNPETWLLRTTLS